VLFGDLGPDGLTGPTPVTITATNARGVTRKLDYSFVVDGTGPIIDITSHESSAVIGKDVLLVFKVTDDTGVDPESVIVKINEVENRYDAESSSWTRNGDTYSFRFDSRTVEGSSTQVTINVLATDIVGVQSEGEALTLWLDNYPPVVDLDPGNVRERAKEGQNVYCSESFDPLGEAKGDLADVAGVARFRALVWDESNVAAGQSVIHLAGADQDSVKLYVKQGTGAGIVKSTTPGGVCNTIDASVFVGLEAVGQAGTSWFNNETADPPALDACVAKNVAVPPPQLCTDNNSDLRRVIQHEIADANEPVIYAHSVQTGKTECTGSDWEFAAAGAASITEGWVCLAAVAKDRIGNEAVSAPIRVCYDDPDTLAEPACKSDKNNPPTCRNDCTLPKQFASQIINR
jgi:hypothetical protein